jgi:hypothetical protein
MAGGTVPVPTPETEPFWAGTLAGELRIQHCKSCGKHYFYPRAFCRYCQSRDVEWRTVSGGEAVRQLRGAAVTQVPGVTISFARGVGLFFGAAGSPCCPAGARNLG